MRQNRGQALVEFILILPVLLLLIFGLIDFGTVLSKKNQLQADLDIVSELYRKSENATLTDYLQDHQLEINYHKEETLLTIELAAKITFITPGLGKILGNPYIVSVSRVIYEK